MNPFKYFFAIFGAILLVVVIISWFVFPDWRATPGGFWTLLGIASVGIAGFLRDVVGITKDLNEMNKNKEDNKLSKPSGKASKKEKTRSKPDEGVLMRALYGCESIHPSAKRVVLAKEIGLTAVMPNEDGMDLYTIIKKFGSLALRFGKFQKLVDQLGELGYEKTEDGNYTNAYKELLKIWDSNKS